MPSIQFKGKSFVESHHLSVPYHQLIPDEDASLTDQVSLTDNLIIHGDNLLALKALLPLYQGKIKCIYIDPPYNTGNEGWQYNDNVNSPMIQEWLEENKPVDKDDLTRHDKWLCMMMPRLRLLWELLRDDGVIFVSIDDNEVHRLRMLMDEIFGEENYLASLYVQVRYADKTLSEDSGFHKQIEIVLCYGKSHLSVLNKPVSEYSFEKFVYDIQETSQPNYTIELGGKRVDVFQKGHYIITKREEPDKSLLKEVWASGKILDGNSSGRFFRDYLSFRPEQDGYEILYKVYNIGDDQREARYFTSPQKAGRKRGKYYQGIPSEVINNPDTQRNSPVPNFYDFADAFGNCTHEGKVSFRSGKKPVVFVRQLISLGTANEDDIVLDAFAGSGTTAHAIMELNNDDGGNRQFILMESEKYADDITAKRVRNVINNISQKGKDKKKLDVTFSFFHVGNPINVYSMLFGENKDLPRYEELARYLFYTTTGEEFVPDNMNEKDRYIGESRQYHVYLLYEPRHEALQTIGLTLSQAEEIHNKYPNKTAIVYAPVCFVNNETLRDLNIEFVRLPFGIYRFPSG